MVADKTEQFIEAAHLYRVIQTRSYRQACIRIYHTGLTGFTLTTFGRINLFFSNHQAQNFSVLAPFYFEED